METMIKIYPKSGKKLKYTINMYHTKSKLMVNGSEAHRFKVVVPVLVLLFVALWFILRGDLLYVLPCVILFLCFSVLLVL